MEYNTTRTIMPIKEYGRSVHNMVQHLLTITDPQLRQKNAEAVIEIMAILNPLQKNVEDYKHKLWDHLFIMSDFKLEVESPYEKPTFASISEKPEPLPYPKNKIKWAHFGKTFELIFERAMAEQMPEKIAGYTHTLALFMKLAYSNWHKENSHDDMIRDELANMSNGKLVYDATQRFSDLVDLGDNLVTQKLSFNRNNFGRNNNNNRNNFRRNNNNNRNNNNHRNNKFNKYKK